MIQYIVKSRKNMLTDAVKHYPSIAPTTPMKLDGAIDLIEKQCTVNSADIKAVLDALENVIVQSLKNGIAIRLGDLGSFRPTLGTKGEDDAAKVSADNIKRVRCRFTPSGSMVRKLAVSNCQFRPYAGASGE